MCFLFQFLHPLLGCRQLTLQPRRFIPCCTEFRLDQLEQLRAVLNSRFCRLHGFDVLLPKLSRSGRRVCIGRFDVLQRFGLRRGNLFFGVSAGPNGSNGFSGRCFHAHAQLSCVLFSGGQLFLQLRDERLGCARPLAQCRFHALVVHPNSRHCGSHGIFTRLF